MSASLDQSSESRSTRALFALMLLTMAFAPLFRGGLQPLASMSLQVAAVALLLAAFWRGTFPLTRREGVALALVACFPLLYMIPLPWDWSEALPGRPFYFENMEALLDAVPAAFPASLVPYRTESAWLALLLPIGVFVATRALNEKHVRLLVFVLIGVAAVQATIGLMQYGAGRESPLYFGIEFGHIGNAIGTYTNRNHLAGLIEMTLPLVLGLLVYSVGRGRSRRGGTASRASFLGSRRGQATLIYASLAVLLILGVIFTRSRTGIALMILGVILVTSIFSRRIGGDNVFGPVGTLVALGIGLAVTIGLIPVLDRFSLENVEGDTRWTVFAAAIAGIGTFFPFGSGPGTFQSVFPYFQVPELGRVFVNRVHNDYLEWVFEGGLIAAALILFLIVLYALQWKRVWAAGPWSELRFLKVSAGVGVFLLLIHELVDYNLHTPANQVFFAFLLGIFFHTTGSEEEAPSRRRRWTPNLGAEPQSLPSVAPIRPVEVPPDQIRNPFLDD